METCKIERPCNRLAIPRWLFTEQTVMLSDLGFSL